MDICNCGLTLEHLSTGTRTFLDAPIARSVVDHMFTFNGTIWLQFKFKMRFHYLILLLGLDRKFGLQYSCTAELSDTKVFPVWKVLGSTRSLIVVFYRLFSGASLSVH